MIIFLIGVACAQFVAINKTQLAIAEDIFNTLNEYSHVLRILEDEGGVLCPTDSPGTGMLMCNQWGDIDSISAPDLELRGNLTSVDFSGLTNVTYINMANNSLYGSIPLNIRNLKKLRFIYLQMNQLTGRIDAVYFSDIQFTLSVCILFGGRMDRNCFEDTVDVRYSKCNGMSKLTQTFCNPSLTFMSATPNSSTRLSVFPSITFGGSETDAEQLSGDTTMQTTPVQSSDPDVLVIAICGTIAAVICIISMMLLGWWIGKKGRKRPALSDAINGEEVPDVADDNDNYVSIPVMDNNKTPPVYDKVLPRSATNYLPAPSPSGNYKSSLTRLP